MPPPSERGISQGIETLGSISEYRYYPQDDVLDALRILGMQPEQEHVSGLYLHKNKETAIAVVEAPESMGEGHFGIIRGVDYLRLMDRTGKLRAHFAGDVQEGYAPHFVRAMGVSFGNLVTPPQTLNVVAQRRSKDYAPYEVYAAVYSGTKIIASAEMLDSSVHSQRIMQMGYDPVIVNARQNGKLLEEPVREALGQFGYGENMMVLNSYLQRDYDALNFPIGGMKVTRENGEAFEFTTIEGFAQLLAFHLARSGYIVPGMVPTFGGVAYVKINAASTYPSEVRLFMKDIVADEKTFSGIGMAILHNDIFAEAKISGRAVAKTTLEGLIARRRRDQANEFPLFPKQ